MKHSFGPVLMWGCCAVWAGCQLRAGGRDRALWVDDTNTFAGRLEARESGSQPGTRPASPVLKASPANLDPPTCPEEFSQAWHFKPVMQGLTGQCWAYAATSFFESEVYRLNGREIKLSEMYTAYWEFVEKARRFVREHGNSEFARGSEPDAVIRIWKTYGIVPAAAYSGMPPGREFCDDRAAYAEMRAHLESLRQRGDWNEERAVTTIRTILDRRFGAVPTSIEVDGQRMSPREYLRDKAGLDLDNYLSLVSLMQEPFYQQCEYKQPDNWRHSRDYFNVPLDDFIKVVRRAADDKQSLCLGVDNTEPGYLARQDVAFVPTFDIPPAWIDDAARQLRFSNGGTTDDHAVHLVGSCRRSGHRWYLIKDSGTRPRNGRQNGYSFYREDYIKLKGPVLMLPRDFAERALKRSLR